MVPFGILDQGKKAALGGERERERFGKAWKSRKEDDGMIFTTQRTGASGDASLPLVTFAAFGFTFPTFDRENELRVVTRAREEALLSLVVFNRKLG